MQNQNLLFITLFTLVCVAFSGCLPQSNTGSALDALKTSGQTTSSYGSFTGGGIAGGSSGGLPTGNSIDFLTINKAVRSNLDPNTLIELIGSGGEIGANCPTNTSCKCQFNWTEPDGSIREATQDPAYTETDMIRCLFTQVSSSAKYFDVRISLNGGLTSNALRVFINTLNPSLNPSLNSNYTLTQRYMCRDLVLMNSNTKYYQSNLLDPRLWDASNSLNLYTTSLGKDYGAIPLPSSTGAANTLQGYECPPLPNDENFDPALDIKLYSKKDINLNNPLQTNVSSGTGDNTIYPSSDNLNLTTGSCVNGNEATCEKFSVNRHDFYLANFQDGVFKIPFCVYHKVGNFTGSLQCKIDKTKGPAVIGGAALAEAGQDIIGFAAIPDGNNNCPDSNLVSLPPNKKWAKLWQFRTSIPQRPIKDVANPDDIGDLFCTTRDFECAGTSAGSACATGVSFPRGPTIGPQQSAQISLTIGSPGFGNCDDTKTDGTGANSCINAGGATATNCCHDIGDGTTRMANFSITGGNFCTPSNIGQNSAYLDGGSALDVWLMGGGKRHACIEADSDISGKLKLKNFPDALGTYKETSTLIDATSHADYVYIVTPTRVTLANMQNPNDPVAQQYFPYRFLKEDKSIRLDYLLESGALNTNNPSERTALFPLCVLQDAK